MNNQTPVLALAWFQAQEWLKLRDAVEDPSTLDDTYDEWRSSAEKAVSEFRAEGHLVKKVSIKTSELLIWCEENGVKPDGKARSEYVAYLSDLKYKEPKHK